MSIGRAVTNGLVGLVLFGLYVASYSGLQHHRRSLPDAGESSSGIWNLSPVIIAAIAGEFKGLMADYLTLEAGARLGAKVIRTPDGKYREVKRRIDWPTIHRLYTASQYLDPSFEQTYMVAQGWLPWEGGMVREMQAILRTAAQARRGRVTSSSARASAPHTPTRAGSPIHFQACTGPQLSADDSAVSTTPTATTPTANSPRRPAERITQ